MSTQMVDEVTELSADDERRPLMTTGNMAWMNLGFFGVQFSFGLTQTAVNPLFLLLGADAHSLPILNIAGPITGLLIQPFIGAMSDKTWIARGGGRRRPVIIGGSVLMIAILFLFPAGDRAVDGVLCLWLVDAGNNTAMEPYRALISDRLRKIQIPKGFLIRACSPGPGACPGTCPVHLPETPPRRGRGIGGPPGCSSVLLVRPPLRIVDGSLAMIGPKRSRRPTKSSRTSRRSPRGSAPRSRRSPRP
jgi:maltose/moltooligosaccharide transporter